MLTINKCANLQRDEKTPEGNTWQWDHTATMCRVGVTHTPADSRPTGCCRTWSILSWRRGRAGLYNTPLRFPGAGSAQRGRGLSPPALRLCSASTRSHRRAPPLSRLRLSPSSPPAASGSLRGRGSAHPLAPPRCGGWDSALAQWAWSQEGWCLIGWRF